MTTIAWDGCTLAADKQASSAGLRRKCAKITRISKGPYAGCLAAVCGGLSHGLLMFEWIEMGADSSNHPTEKDGERNTHILLITPKGEILVFEQEPVPCIFEDTLFAMGSGREYALGAMATGSSARESVEIAMRFDINSGMGIDVLHLQPSLAK